MNQRASRAAHRIELSGRLIPEVPELFASHPNEVVAPILDVLNAIFAGGLAFDDVAHLRVEHVGKLAFPLDPGGLRGWKPGAGLDLLSHHYLPERRLSKAR